MANKRYLPQKGCNPVLAHMSQERRDATLIKATNKANKILALMVLGDEFDFTSDDMRIFLIRYQSEMQAYQNGYVGSVKEFEEVLKDEFDIVIPFE